MLFVHGHRGSQSCLKFPSRERCHCMFSILPLGQQFFPQCNKTCHNYHKRDPISAFDCRHSHEFNCILDYQQMILLCIQIHDIPTSCVSIHNLDSFTALTFTVSSTEATCTVTYTGSVIQGPSIPTHSTTGYNPIKEKKKVLSAFLYYIPTSVMHLQNV